MSRLTALILPLLALPVLVSFAPTAIAQQISYETVTETVTVEEEVFEIGAGANERFVAAQPAIVQPAPVPHGIARFGPFRVLDNGRAALVDVTDERSPAAFAAMVRAYPGLSVIEMIECPGTEDDRANLKVGRMIRARGMATHVPAGGSVRSGGVELFLAGTHHTADHGAEFAVHSWADEDGREAKDYPASAPENRAYIDYYKEMGMTPVQATAFYAMTNSVPNADAKWLTAAEMGQWVSYN